MNKKSNPISLIAIVFIIGVISSFVTSDFEIGALFENLGGDNIKATLDSINLGLGVLALVLVVIFLFYRSATGKKDRQAESWQDQDQIDD